MTDEVIAELLSKKGVNPGSEGYEEKKKELTAKFNEEMAEATVEAILFEEDRKKFLKAIEDDAEPEELGEMLKGFEIRVDVVKNAFSDFVREYLEEK